MSEIMERLRSALADRYELEREIGRGGMATVYLARDIKHGRPVAKLIRYERQSASLIGSLRDKIEIRGDILSTGVDWRADGQP